LRLFLSVWLVNNSALCRMMRDRIRDRAGEHNRMKRAAAATISAPGPSVQYEVALKKLDVYKHTIQQFHRLLNLDGVQDVFTLQPEIAVSRKQFGDTETKIFDYYRRLEGEASVYGFQRLYPELNRRLSTDSQREGYRFVDLTNVFDDMTIQAFTDYCHLTPAGNHAVAEALFKSLSASFREKAAAP